MISGAKTAGDQVQAQFTPDWVLRTAAATAKRWFLSELAKAVEPSVVAGIWTQGGVVNVNEAQARQLLSDLWTHLREKF